MQYTLLPHYDSVPYQRSSSSLADAPYQKTIQSEKSRGSTPVPSSPSQIPDSQPEVPTTHDVQDVLELDFVPSTPTSKALPDVPSTPVDVDSVTVAPTIFKPTTRPPRAASLPSLNSPPQQSQPTTDTSTSPDRRPHRYPLFTSTPKSKPLKYFLSAEVRGLITVLMEGATWDHISYAKGEWR